MNRPVDVCTKEKKKVAVARVLTSAESLALLEQKERQKRELEEAKERRKIEREKKLAREAEKVRKDEERKRKALEREEIKKLQQQKKELKQRKSSSKQIKNSAVGRGLQLAELSNNECGVCIGAYEDDFNTDGELVREWVQCTNKACGIWMHEDCLNTESDGELLICSVCKSVFQ